MVHHPGQPAAESGVTAEMPPRLREAVSAGSDVRSAAPGRANLIGEHTDYNDGWVLPVALELRTWVAGRSGGERIRLRSLDEAGAVDLDARSGEGTAEGWGRYAQAVARALVDAGWPLRGLDGVVASDVPIGSGLSSSAALEVAVALALLSAERARDVDRVELARICQRAENEYVGVRCGIMDQLAAAASVAGAATLIDCRSLQLRPIRLPTELAVLVIDSEERRQLTGGEYNRRRAECEEAAALLGVPALRDATPGDLARLAQLASDTVRRRARHVIGENERTRLAAGALERDDRDALGRLFAASHASLRDDLEVSTPRLDLLVELAAHTPGVVAARMTGAGFGGCTVQLVERARGEQAARQIAEAYRSRTGVNPRWWLSGAGAGAEVRA